VNVIEAVRRFRSGSSFGARGGVVTDLDGTALYERAGHLYVVDSVAESLKALAELGRPVVLNTLRFPLNVVRTFGREWSAITSRPVPLVSLNGAVVGLLIPEDGDWTSFQELVAFPMSKEQGEGALVDIERLIAAGLLDVIVFIYPRDWRAGEIVWTPEPARVDALRAKYVSATEVVAGPIEVLRRSILSHEVCMLSILVDIPEDRRMAYQHVSPSQFFTARGVDKLSGAREAAAHFGFELQESVGAGDTPMDRFLEGVGLGFHVGPLQLSFRAQTETLRLDTPQDLGHALFELARLEPRA
jgi:hydroxymethylpyrimidine pyrophosphatase-like HAD family hydrolase